MLNLVKDDAELEQKRCRLRDQERDDKIKFFTNQLMAKNMTSGEFLEAMGNKQVLPETCK